MITITGLASEALGYHLEANMERRFGCRDARMIDLGQLAARLVIQCIAHGDALYHNVEHFLFKQKTAYDILKGRRLLKETNADDYAHVLVACLFHDIGYVRGILDGNNEDGYVIDAKGNKA